MYYTYILYSPVYKKYYIGHTEDVVSRVERHNKGKSNYTRKYLPWILVHCERYKTRARAMKREREIKSYKGGKAFKKLLTIASR